MIESLRDYWYMWLLLLLLIALAVWAGTKASKAVRKKNEIMRKQEQDWKRQKFLAEKYGTLTETIAKEADPAELAEGVTAVLQNRLDQSANPDEMFRTAPEWQKNVYALFYFDEDCQDSLSFFCRHNEDPLPSAALQGLQAIGEKKVYSAASAMYAMYDEKNEGVSLDRGRVSELDEKFRQVFDRDRFFAAIKDYILSVLQTSQETES